MTASRFRIGSSIFGEVAEEKINGPCRCMPKLCKLSGIQPEHETCHHSFKLATVASSLLHYFVVGLVPGIRGIQFIINTLLATSDWRFPEPFERHEMETLGFRLHKYCSYNIKDGSVAKAIHSKCQPITFLLSFPCRYCYVDQCMFPLVDAEYIFW